MVELPLLLVLVVVAVAGARAVVETVGVVVFRDVSFYNGNKLEQTFKNSELG